MKRKITITILLSLLLSACLTLSSAAYVRVSYGVDCLASSGELIKTGLRGEQVCFSQADFRQALGMLNVRDVAILSLPDPAAGVLACDGRAVVAGEVLAAERLDLLSFTPAAEGVEYATFRFAPNTASGTTAVTCTVRLVDRVNAAPSVTEPTRTLSTRAGIALYGRLAAEDPEGDDFTYLVVSYPKKGQLTLAGATGEYRYMPRDGQTGDDVFSYVVRDAWGNYSAVATVGVTLAERTDALFYADMADDPAHNAALTVSERGLMAGTIEGDARLFLPDEGMTRAAFLTAAMKSAGVRPAAGMVKTWFDDDGAIRDGERPYVATAQLYGYITGTFDGETLTFSPNESITCAEAAVIVDRILSLPHAAGITLTPDGTPRYAREAVAALASEKVMTFSAETTGKLTRREAAVLLSSVLEYAAKS